MNALRRCPAGTCPGDTGDTVVTKPLSLPSQAHMTAQMVGPGWGRHRRRGSSQEGNRQRVRAAIGGGELDEGARAGAVREDFLEGRRVMLLMTEAPVFKHTRLPWHPCLDARVPADGPQGGAAPPRSPPRSRGLAAAEGCVAGAKNVSEDTAATWVARAAELEKGRRTGRRWTPPSHVALMGRGHPLGQGR